MAKVIRETANKTTEDFIRWENIPLDFFLGEFTEEEGKSESSHDSDSDNVAVQPKVSKVSQFQCPRCPKTYASISGFRGHVSKKHDEPQLKATDHRLDQPGHGPDLGDGSSTSTSSGDIHFAYVSEVVKAAIPTTAKDSTFNLMAEELSFKTVSKKLLDCTDTVDNLSKCLIPLVSAVKQAVKAGMYEKMWTLFHEMSTHPDLTDHICSTIISNDELVSREIAYMYTMCLLDSLVTTLLQLEKKSEEKTVDAAMDTVSAGDQAVIFYIAGNLIHSLSKKTKIADTQAQIQALCASDSESEQEVPSHIAAWLKSKDRGGLKTPSLKFYKLVLMFESIMRRVVDVKALDAMSLSTVRLKETILSDRTVQMTWQDISNFSGHQKLLENFITYFLTVRGFAITKFIKRQEQKKNKFNIISRNKSLRKNLKRC